MSQQPMVGCRVPSDWHEAIIVITEATGQTASEVVREAIALYLKKAKAVTVKSRLDAVEDRLNKLAALVMQ